MEILLIGKGILDKYKKTQFSCVTFIFRSAHQVHTRSEPNLKHLCVTQLFEFWKASVSARLRILKMLKILVAA